MNLFQIILKNMRQRALGTWLTLLSVTLGVGLAVAVLIVYREGKSLFGQTEFGYDVIVGPRLGSAMQLVMNTVYHVDQSPGNLPYSVYESLLTDPQYRRNVKIAIPVAVGDSYKNLRLVATTPRVFGFETDGATRLPDDGVFEYINGKRYQIDGKCFHGDKFEAVIGSDVTKLVGLDVGQPFRATHGMPATGEVPDIHAEKWTVVGRLKKTGTAVDHVIFIPLTTFYCIQEHEEGLEAQAKIKEGADPTKMGATTTAPTPAPEPAQAGHDDHDHQGAYDLNPDGTIHLHLPKDQWQVSAVLVKARGGVGSAFRADELVYLFRVRNDALAVKPAIVMREFFDNFLKGSTLVLLLISALVTVVAAVGILVSIYNSVSARKREIAVLRALGATRGKILAIICLEAGLIGLIGGLLGLVLGHLIGAIGSGWLQEFMGQGINWTKIDARELLYLVGVFVLSILAGLVPAWAAYQTPVATNLVPS
jgi:putative ABC transport system permease protein